MNIIISNSNINKYTFNKKISKIIATEFSNLASPCYYPSLKNTYYEILNECGLSDYDIGEFRKRLFENIRLNKLNGDFSIFKDNMNLLLLFCIFYFLRKKDIENYKLSLTMLGIKYYSNEANKRIKYCIPEVFKYTLESINPLHLFKRENGISNFIIFLSKEIDKRYRQDLESEDILKVIKFVYEYRHRFAQSLNSFAQLYYYNYEHKKGINTPKEFTDDEGNKNIEETVEKGSKLIDLVLKKLTIFKYISVKGLKKSNIDKLDNDIIIKITEDMTNPIYIEYIRILLKEIIKNLKDVKQICGDGYISFSKKIIKNNFRVNETLDQLLSKILEKEYLKFNDVQKDKIKLFLIFYIFSILQETICK